MRITQDKYDKYLEKFKRERKQLEYDLENLNTADENFKTTTVSILDLVKRAKRLFKISKPKQKQQLLNLLLSNCQLDGTKLVYELKEPFNAIVECAKSGKWYNVSV